MEGVSSTAGAAPDPAAAGGPPATSEAARALREVLRVAGDTRSALARRLGIGITDAAAIDHLVSSAEPLGPVELGNRLGIRSASATTLVDRLVQAGHVERAPHPSDRRRLSLQVTEHAVTEVLAALRPMLTGVEQAVARLTPEQAAATTAFLREVAEVMRDYIATAPDDPTTGRRSAAHE